MKTPIKCHVCKKLIGYLRHYMVAFWRIKSSCIDCEIKIQAEKDVYEMWRTAPKSFHDMLDNLKNG